VNTYRIEIASTDNPALESFLGDRLYEFNSDTTGIRDGQLLWASLEDRCGNVIAGVSGHTWGHCCEIARLWVHESRRGEGLGLALMEAAEAEARRRNCRQIVLSTHSFQAPQFYEKLGFERIAAIPNYPAGHEQIFFVKYI
jgi:GNAT superfamily N-acetyltransferase